MLLLLVSGCGGGGGGTSGPLASSNTFDVKSGWVRLVANGFTKNLTISGTCTGTYSSTNSPATTGATFEGTSVLSNTSVDTITLTNCTPTSTVNTETDYYDSNYMPVGYSVLGGDYAVWTTTATLPTAARVGDASVIGTANIYSDNTKTTRTGKQDATLVIESDTGTTAIANIVLKYYTATDVLKQTQQRRFRIAADGSLTLISIDVQFANGSTTHLIMN
jgi:hypothetical protein